MQINILHIADYMLKYSSEINMVSVNDIADYLYSRITYIEEMKNGALIRTVNPVRIMWSNGYYYYV